MNSVLDGIGGTDSDTSGTSGDGEPKMKRRAISLKVRHKRESFFQHFHKPR